MIIKATWGLCLGSLRSQLTFCDASEVSLQLMASKENHTDVALSLPRSGCRCFWLDVQIFNQSGKHYPNLGSDAGLFQNSGNFIILLYLC